MSRITRDRTLTKILPGKRLSWKEARTRAKDSKILAKYRNIYLDGRRESGAIKTANVCNKCHIADILCN